MIAFWDKGFRSRNAKVLDVQGRHPHIKTLKRQDDVDRVWEYMHKEEGAEQFGTWEGPIKVDTQKRKVQETWAYIGAVRHLLIYLVISLICHRPQQWKNTRRAR